MVDGYEEGRMRARLAQARKLFKRYLVLQAAMEIGDVPYTRLEELKRDVKAWLGRPRGAQARRKARREAQR